MKISIYYPVVKTFVLTEDQESRVTTEKVTPLAYGPKVRTQVLRELLEGVPHKSPHGVDDFVVEYVVQEPGKNKNEHWSVGS